MRQQHCKPQSQRPVCRNKPPRNSQRSSRPALAYTGNKRPLSLHHPADSIVSQRFFSSSHKNNNLVRLKGRHIHYQVQNPISSENSLAGMFMPTL